MQQGRLIFSQVMDVFHREQFQRCVARHPTPRASKRFFARDQFLAMAFAQLTYRESLRDIEDCLIGNPKLYAMDRGYVDFSRLYRLNEDGGY